MGSPRVLLLMSTQGQCSGNINAILVGLNVSYEKKARGELRAECKCSVPTGDTSQEVAIETEVKDKTGDVVTRAIATWLVGPK